MRKKQLILAVVFMVGLAIVSWLTRDKSVKGSISEGDFVFESVDIKKIEKILIEGNGSSTELNVKGKKWTLKNRYDMDVDPSLVRNFKNLISKVKAIQVVPHEEKDLSLFKLDDSALKVKIFHKGEMKPVIYRFGKFHAFQKEGAGRYVYIEDKKSIVMLASPLNFVSEQPRAWLKKYLPHVDQLAGVSLYYDGTILWKTARNNARDQFRLIVPANSNKTPQAVNNLIKFAMQMRFMDITPALNDFVPDKQYQQVQLYFQTFAGRTYSLSFLKKDGNNLRCRLTLQASKVSTEFIKQYGSVDQLREEIAEWHFIVPAILYNKLFEL